MRSLLLFLSFTACSYCTPGWANSPSDSTATKLPAIPEQLGQKDIRLITKRYEAITKKLNSYTAGTLEQLQKKEMRLQKQLQRKDSIAAKQLFLNAHEHYARLLQQMQQPAANLKPSLGNYLPRLDSLQTAFHFLDKAGIPLHGLGQSMAQLTQLQARLQSAADIRQFIKERQQVLQTTLDKYGLGKALQRFRKQAYYYQEQVNEYKAMINDPQKLEQRAMGLVRELPAFKDFMSKNSQLAQLFAMPAGYGSEQALQGLQTRAEVQQQLSQQLAGAGSSPQQYLQQQVQQAQNELNQLKDRINNLGGNSSDMAMPDFKPNHQKTKTFWKRIEYGLSLQTQKNNVLLPTTTDMALTAGYKLNDKSIIGIGASYKLGWGKDIGNINLSSQGVGLRSYVDVKLKGSVWISGGYEYNYQQEFKKLEQLRGLDAWQKSGLIGLSKKYKLGKKKGNLQLLWDFLSYNQIPRTQPLKFRVGYVF
jgi:hypothetical protein